MMNINGFKTKILNDIRVELLDEFDKNFERKGFFDTKWQETRYKNPRGSLMLRSGRLRRSYRGNILTNGVGFSSSMAYAGIHNRGGKIPVTPKMRRFFWAKYYENSNNMSTLKSGKVSGGVHNAQTATKAEYWRNMAMIRSGSITIPQRQVVGHHPQLNPIVRNITTRNFKEISKDLSDRLKQHLNHS